MSNLLWDGLRADKQDHRQDRGLDRYDPDEIDPPEPLQMFTRLGLLLVIALNSTRGFVGSAGSVAATLQRYADAGVVDGFNITPYLIPDGLDPQL